MDLSMKPYQKRLCQLLSEATKKMRFCPVEQILQWLCQDRLPLVLWKDEKIFTFQDHSKLP
ncbi:Hypothetical protein FKW44_022547 [Caligus rogercresseyi]|uniref:Uncharacterized protein n=1 Tax=Caligus rogercresseyi TaxID=217165 RepID=A0A7T8GNL1_CALRO|nr:Hypothetical protein FKW44_022547 [Caligus rogercresseyi]